jgi:hypothetical protein
MRRVLMLVAAMLLIGCDDDSSGPNEVLDGRWVGSHVTPEFSSTITMTLAQTGSELLGNGTLADDVGTNAIVIVGTYVAPDVEFEIQIPNVVPPQNPILFTGTVSEDDAMSGTLNGSGYNGIPMTFERQ